MWRMALTSKSGNRITLDTQEEDLQSPDEMAMATIKYHVASVYECENKEQLTKYYHSSLGSHPKTTLISAAKIGYLRWIPGFNAKAITKFIGVEDATEMGHMRQVHKGVKSTTTKSNRGRPKSQLVSR